ncbi:mannose-1-phosphate guanylyltransferase/mannose-6-phosphate isomerase [Terasakiella pusilla]|uniref:mannose-1-phosphate guanylyltransferase/mannose-6-phosphate isomerase n=1 Tax=Terasakiella pusilla TaxID=64973 RepID=UPI00056E548A|nr:mannose-1-phosphate guanylyltransferase/mannose-6-phosphate isomerase [Terasakiella pusilla]
MKRITPVILSGGSGTRLWPLSRQDYPKQFLSLFNKNSLIEQTIQRIQGPDYEPGLIICNEEHRFMVAESCRKQSYQPEKIILEPEGRNTAPALTIAALYALSHDPDSLLLVLPSDHFIEPNDAFHDVIAQARDAACADKLVSFGITPTQAYTGYGYIEKGEVLENTESAFHLKTFIEKPDQNTAKQLVKKGFLWNSGMFMFKAQVLIDEMEVHQPTVTVNCREAFDKASFDIDFMRIGKESFRSCSHVSIDYAVMEKTDKACVVSFKGDWQDLGSFDTLTEIACKQGHKNAITGDVIARDCQNSFIWSDNQLVTTLGLESMIVVSTSDAILVCPRDKSQNIPLLLEEVKQQNRSQAVESAQSYRFWGHYKVLEKGGNFLVKKIVVSSGAKLSLQRHRHRAEHWIIVKGVGHVTKGDETFIVRENESLFIPPNTVHRLENRMESDLYLIEVQTGDYIGEDDIERIDDAYAREIVGT